MCKLNKNIPLVALAAIMVGVLLTACSSIPSPTPSPTPSPVPSPPPNPVQSQEKVEDELVAFILDYLILPESASETGSTNDFGQSWIEYIDVPSIIIWAPANDDPERSHETLNTTEPIKVWWFENNRLSEVTSKTEAIEQYQLDYMSDQDAFICGYYEFGIISVAENGQEAEVYLGTVCGRLCGNGTIYTLQRNEFGQWEITDSELLWIS
jgi:hypothetical protein